MEIELINDEQNHIVLFLYILISTMRTHNTNETNSTRGYGETECDRKLKLSSFTVPEVVAAIRSVVTIRALYTKFVLPLRKSLEIIINIKKIK